MAMTNDGILSNFIGGEFTLAATSKTLEIRNPATGELLTNVPISTGEDVNKAVWTAKNAFNSWRNTPALERTRYLFKLKSLFDDNLENLAQAVTKEHGKNLAAARSSVKCGIENIEHACGIPALMMGDSLEDVASGVDSQTVR